MSITRVPIALLVTLGACSSATVEPPPPPAPAPAPVPVPPRVDLSLGEAYELRPPIHDGRLAIVPIVARAPDPVAYLTLDDGMAHGVVTVREKPSFDVPRVLLTNASDLPLVVLSGEILVEGHQDRVIAETRTIAAGATVELAVNCVEVGRSHGNDAFAPGNAMAELALRAAIGPTHDVQSDVWRTVKQLNADHRVTSPTQSYRASLDERRTGAAAARHMRLVGALLERREARRLVGFAVAIDGRVIAIERFSTTMFAKLADKLVASYVASEPVVKATPPRALVPADVREFARSGATAAITTAVSFQLVRPEPPLTWE